MRELDYASPSTIEEASSLLTDTEGAIALAGGTDVVVGLRSGKVSPPLVVDLKCLPGLDAIVDEGACALVGALVSMTAISRSSLLRRQSPALARAASQMGCWQVRNLATLGGNLCNASPSADTLPPLLLHGASVLLAGAEGTRELPLEAFLAGPGSTVLRGGELLTAVRVPYLQDGTRSMYVRRAIRRSMDIPLVNIAVAVREIGGVVADARVVLGAVGPVPFRSAAAEAALVGRSLTDDAIAAAAAGAMADSRPITDIRASGDYRRTMVEVFVRRALTGLRDGEAA